MSDYLPPVVVELEGRDAQLRATLQAAKAHVRQWAVDVGKTKATVDVKLDIANGEIQKVQRRVGQIRATARVGLRLEDTAPTAARLDELTRRREATVGAKLDIASGEVQKIQQQIGRIRATVRVGLRLDETAVTTTSTHLDELTRDREVLIRTRAVGGAPGSGGAGGRRGMLMTLATFAPVLAPVLAHTAAVTASLTAALGASTVAVGVFGVAVISQLSALGDAADATKKYREAVAQYGATSDQAAKAQQEVVRTFAQMPTATRQAAGAYLNLKTSFKSWSDQLSKFTMVPVTQGIGILEAMLPKLSPLVKGTSAELTRFTTLLGGGINSGAFDGLMARFTEFTNGALKRGVDHAIHFVRVMSEGGGGGAFSEFMAYAKANGPLVEETLKNLASAVTTILKAAGEAGPGMLALVNSFAQLVAALPPSLLATLMQVAVALKLIALTRAGILLVSGAVTGFIGRLTTMHATSVAAGGGLAGLRAAFLALSTAAKATVILAVLAAIGVAVAKIASLGQEAPPDIDRLTNSLGRLGESGTVKGEALRQYGADLGKLRDSIKSFVAPSVLDNIQQGLVKVLTLGTTDSTPVKQAKEDVEAIDKSLAGLVQNGNADLAAAALEKLKAAYGKGGHDVDKFTSSLNEYEKAVDDAKFAQELAAQSQGLFGQQAQATQRKLDGQKASADGLRKSIQALADTSRSAFDAQTRLEEAVDNVTKSIKDNGRTLDIGTEKGRANRDALSQVASATQEAAATARENGASWSTVVGIYDKGRKSLVDNITAITGNRKEAEKLAGTLLKFDGKTKTTMLKADITDWKSKISAAEKQLKGAKGDKKAKLTADIADWTAKVAKADLQLKGAKADKRAKLTADIAEWKAKVALAERQLRTAKGEKKATLKADVKDWNAKITAAQKQINNLPASKSTTLRVTTLNTTINQIKGSVHDVVGATGGLFTGEAFKRGYAEGGPVRGPGTGTSDDVFAPWLSNGEFVMKAAAVQKYGEKFMYLVNSGRLEMPGFAKGGKVTKAQKQRQERAKAERQARAEMSSQFGISPFGMMAGYQVNSFEKSLGKPADLNSLVTSLNGLRGQIKAAFSGGTESSLLKQLNKAGKALITYEKQHAKVSASLEKAKDKLDGLRDSAAQLKESVASSILSGSSVVTQAPQEGFGLTSQDVVNNMAAQLQKVQQFSAQLELLKKRGLSADLLQEIAAAGVDQGGATAAALAGASDATLKQLNSMHTQMEKAANKAGAAVADSMYGAGIRAAEGLVKGLTQQKKAIENAMMAIAKGMEKALKAALGIKSPSIVMAKLGDFTALGVAKGIDRSRKHAVIAARGLAMSVQQGAALTGSLPLTATMPAIRPSAAAVVHHHYEPHITVEGHVLTERKLRDIVEEQMLRQGMRNPTTYSSYKR